MNCWTEFRIKGGFTQPENLGLFVKCVVTTWSWKHPLAFLLAIIFFVLAHHAWKKGTIQKKGAGGKPARAVWLWGSSSGKAGEFTTQEVLKKPGPYLAWAKKQNVNQTWIDVWPVLQKKATVSSLNTFCKLAFQQAMDVNFLALASPHFLLSAYHADAVKQLGDVYDLIGQIDKHARPSGIQTDIEPHQLNDKFYENNPGIKEAESWSNDASKIPMLKLYVAMLTKLKASSNERNQKLGAYVNLTMAVPYWWLNESVSYGSPVKTPVGKIMVSLGVDVAVMDYRKSLARATKYATEWIEVAGASGQLAWIGFETAPLSGSEAPLTYNKKIGQLEPDIIALSNTFDDSAGFATVVVHHARSYGNLVL